jgi:NAD(P)-dependent dehydrogenase (short-subunit alcohol dehydrogenase family)
MRLAAEGATVAVNYRRDEEAAATSGADIEAAGGTAKAYQASIDSWDDDKAMVEAVLADLGAVDILVNNGGIASRGLKVADTDPAELERVVRTHAIGPHFLSKLVVPSMRTRPRGDIVMISSVATNAHSANGAPYNMGKAAQEALALTLAKEERDNGIHVNIVAPGLVATDMGDRLARAIAGVQSAAELDKSSPFGRVCRPDDVADVVLFLVSEAAGYLTGQRIEVDGGGMTSRF